MNSRMSRVALVAAALGGAAAFLGACQSMAKAPERPPLGLVSQVDLSRFMGDGYVIANIPTFVEKGSYLAADYGQTMVTREKRDYVWIMARTPTMSEADLQKLITFVGKQGYDTSKLERVPQQAGG